MSVNYKSSFGNQKNFLTFALVIYFWKKEVKASIFSLEGMLAFMFLLSHTEGEGGTANEDGCSLIFLQK